MTRVSFFGTHPFSGRRLDSLDSLPELPEELNDKVAGIKVYPFIGAMLYELPFFAGRVQVYLLVYSLSFAQSAQ